MSRSPALIFTMKPDTNPTPTPRLCTVPSASANRSSLEWISENKDEWQLTRGAVIAMVTLGLPGRWMWQVFGGQSGVCASKEAAMEAAEAHVRTT